MFVMDQQEQFKTVKVYGRLVTEDDPKFDRLLNDDLEDTPVEKSEIVLPVFDVVFEDFDTKPGHSLTGMIQSEIDQSAAKNRDMAKVIHETAPEEVVEQPPFGKPKTTAVPVGRVAVTPSHEGLISEFTFDNLLNIVDEKSK